MFNTVNFDKNLSFKNKYKINFETIATRIWEQCCFPHVVFCVTYDVVHHQNAVKFP